MCPDLQAAGVPGFVLMYQAGWAWRIEFSNVLGSLGKTLIDAETGQPNFNSPEGIQAAELLQQMFNECGDPDAGEYGTTDIAADFQTGRYIVGQTWASRAIEMDDPNVSTELDNVKFAPALDTGTGTLAAPAYIDGWGIAADTSADTEALFLAIMAATDRESQIAAAEFSTVTRTGVSNPDGPRNADAAATSYTQGKGADLAHPGFAIADGILSGSDGLITLGEAGADPATVLAAAEAAYIAEATAQGVLN